MLEGLFEEENSHTKDGNTGSSRGGSYPRVPRWGDDIEDGHKLVGIANQGATCYLNSLIQTLFYTPELRDAVLGLEEKDVGKYGDPDARVIPLELQMLFAEMLILNENIVSTAALTDSFGWKDDDSRIQSDVQELNRILFTALEDSLAGTSSSDLINHFYRGATVNQIKCKECGYTSEREEHFMDLTVAVSGYADLFDSLNDCYLNVETLSGSNQYRCERCGKLVDAEKGAKIRQLPPILTFCLMRLTFDMQTLRRKKETSVFKFPESLCMDMYVEETSGMDDYELFSVVVHRGGSDGGHYHALIKDIDQLGNWTKPKGKIETTNELNNKRKSDDNLLTFATPYELLEHILSVEKTPITAERLNQLIMKETGVPWNKRYKKKYGSIGKFLTDHPNLYLYEETSRQVMLLSNTEEEEITTTESNSPPATTRTEANERAEPDGHWFSFDDRRVEPILPSMLEKYYGGKECAYMLFYRRKDLKRPLDSKNNPYYAVPNHVKEVIEQRNQELLQEREAELAKLNTIKLKVHLQSQYKYCDDYVMAKTDHVYQEIEYDQRKTILELSEYIKNHLEDDDSDGTDLYLVRSLDCGVLHIHSSLTEGADCDMRIAASGLTAGTGLLWTLKSALEKHHVLLGPDNEPYKIHYEMNQLRGTVITAKSKHLPDLCSLILSRLSLDPPVFIYQKNEEKVGGLIELSSSLDVPVSSLLTDDATLLISKAQISLRNFRNGLSISVDYTDLNESGQANVKCISVVIERSQQVAELTQQICQQFKNEHNIELTFTEIRLRPVHDGKLSPPLFNNMSLDRCAIKNGDVLAVEKGTPIPSGDIVLYYQTTDESDGKTGSVTCKCNHTVAKLQEFILKSQGSDIKAEFYLQSSDWMGMPSDIIYDTCQTLAKARISHGDTVYLNKGPPPPKDLVTITVHQVVSNNTSFEDWLASLLQSLSLDKTNQGAPAVSPFTISMSLDSTIGDVKEKLMEILALDVPTTEFIRLRSYADNQSGKIHKTPEKTLRSLKIKGQTALCFEILNEPEALRDDQLVLELTQKLDNGSFAPCSSFIWDTSQGANYLKLRSAIANHVNIDEKLLNLGKYKSAQFQWMKIQNAQPAKGSKAKSKEKSLLKAPYSLQDGDVIGCFSVEDKHIWKCGTYQSELDSKYQQLLVMLKRDRRETKGKNADVLLEVEADSSDKKSPKSRAKERALSIKVGNFKREPDDNIQ